MHNDWRWWGLFVNDSLERVIDSFHQETEITENGCLRND